MESKSEITYFTHINQVVNDSALKTHLAILKLFSIYIRMAFRQRNADNKISHGSHKRDDYFYYKTVALKFESLFQWNFILLSMHSHCITVYVWDMCQSSISIGPIPFSLCQAVIY